MQRAKECVHRKTRNIPEALLGWGDEYDQPQSTAEVQMGLFDQVSGSLKGAVGAMVAGEAPALISAVLAKTNMGDMQGLVNQLQQGGLGDQVKSWLSNGANMKVTPEQLQAALGSDQVRQIAGHFGVSPDAALKLLSEHLPTAVDQASPNGTLAG